LVGGKPIAKTVLEVQGVGFEVHPGDESLPNLPCCQTGSMVMGPLESTGVLMVLLVMVGHWCQVKHYGNDMSSPMVNYLG